MALTASTIFRLVNEMHSILDPECESEIDEQEVYAILSSLDSVGDHPPRTSIPSPKPEASSSLQPLAVGSFPSIIDRDSRTINSNRKGKRKASEFELENVSSESSQVEHRTVAKRRKIVKDSEPISHSVVEPARKPPRKKFADPSAQRLAEDYRETCRVGTYHRYALRRTSRPRLLRASSAPPELGVSVSMSVSTEGPNCDPIRGEIARSTQKVEPDSPQLEAKDLLEIHMGAEVWHSSDSADGDYLANGRRRRRELELQRASKRNDSDAPPPVVPLPECTITLPEPPPRSLDSWPHKSQSIMEVVYEKGLGGLPPTSRGPPPRPHFPVFAREGSFRVRPRVAFPF